MAKGDDIQERLIDFAVKIIHLCSDLFRTTKNTGRKAYCRADIAKCYFSCAELRRSACRRKHE